MNEKIPKKIGLYDVTAVLGQGGMSTVYKGIQPSLNRPVAIKVLPLHLAREQELIDRFERESSIIATLNHPNIIQIIDRGADEGRYFIVMEYVEGTSLDALIHEKNLPIYEIVHIAVQIAKGLEYAHAKGVIHRDIKPANILISGETGAVKITDFGIAKVREEELSSRTLTREQVAIGTVDYMSPEQRKDSRSIDGRSDIFSFGILLFEMITGKIPVGRFHEPEELRDDTPPLLNQVVLRCLQEDPGDRYPSFTSVIDDLKRLTEKELVYREILARVGDSVLHAPKKAKTVIWGKFTTLPHTKRVLVTAGCLILFAALAAGILLFAGRKGGGQGQETAVLQPPGGPVAGNEAPDVEPTPKIQQASPETTVPVPPPIPAPPAAALPAKPPEPPKTVAKAEAPKPVEIPPALSKKPTPKPVRTPPPASAFELETVDEAFTPVETLLAERNYAEALSVLREIRKSASAAGNKQRGAEAQWYIGKVHEEMGNHGLASMAFGHFVDTYGEYPEIVTDDWMAEALYRAGKSSALAAAHKDAVRHFRRLRQEYPSNPHSEDALFQEATLLSDHAKVPTSKWQAHYDGVASLYRDFLDLYPASSLREEAYWRLAQTYLKLGGGQSWARAIVTLEEMAKQYPRSSHLPLFEAAEVARLKLLDQVRARRLYEEFLEACPDSPRAPEAEARLQSGP